VNATGSAIIYSTFLGGDGVDTNPAVALDSQGNAFVSTSVSSSNFPRVGTAASTLRGPSDIGVTKINSTGTAFLYSTLIGGDDIDNNGKIAVDRAGNAYVSGVTNSLNFPGLTANSINSTQRNGDGVLAVLDAAGGTITYATLIGGSGGENAEALALAPDAAAAYLAGGTSSSDFPATAGIAPPAFPGERDAFLSKLQFAPEPLPSVSSSALLFGNTGVGLIAGPRILTMMNRGSGSFRYDRIAISGVNAADFQFAGILARPCAQIRGTLAPGASCTIGISFKPRGPGHSLARLTIEARRDDQPCNFTVRLEGIGQTSPYSVCNAQPWRCPEPLSMSAGILVLKCDGHPCSVIDPIPRNCLVKWGGCPWCEGGANCPFYEMAFDGLGKAWSVKVITRLGKSVPQDVRQSGERTLLRFRPSSADFIEKAMSEYLLIFELTPSGEVGRQYKIPTALKTEVASTEVV
jgi:hypothetical protein